MEGREIHDPKDSGPRIRTLGSRRERSSGRTCSPREDAQAGSQRESPRDTTHTFGNTTVGQGCGRQALAGKARCALRVATLGLWFPSPWQRGSRGPQRGRGSPGQGLVRPPRPGVAPALLRALSSVRSRPRGVRLALSNVPRSWCTKEERQIAHRQGEPLLCNDRTRMSATQGTSF